MKRILVIDGGGQRGLIALSILQEIEKRVGAPIWQLFDIIVGSSAGGIIALAIGISHYPVTDLIQLFQRLGNKVFKGSQVKKFLRLMFTGSMYNSAKLERVLEQVVQESHNGNNNAINMRDTTTPLVCVVTENKDMVGYPFLLRNYENNIGQAGSMNVNVVQAGLATSAISFGFKEVTIEGGTIRLGDPGQAGMNNPIEVAMQEARSLGWAHDKIELVVSIGTGYANFRVSSRNPIRVLRDFIRNNTERNRAHERMLNDYRYKGKYFRFDPPGGIGDASLDETRQKVLSHMQAVTIHFLRNDGKDSFDSIIAVLKAPLQFDLSQYDRYKMDRSNVMCRKKPKSIVWHTDDVTLRDYTLLGLNEKVYVCKDRSKWVPAQKDEVIITKATQFQDAQNPSNKYQIATSTSWKSYPENYDRTNDRVMIVVRGYRHGQKVEEKGFVSASDTMPLGGYWIPVVAPNQRYYSGFVHSSMLNTNL